MAQWNIEFSDCMNSPLPKLQNSPNSIDKIDYKIFEEYNISPDLNRFFSQASEKNNIKNLKISRIKKKISKICEDMINISNEAFLFMEEGNALQVLKKKSEFKPEFLRGIWKNYKKFLSRSVKSITKIFQNEKEFNIVMFVEKYLETCLLNLKFFFVHLYEMATKFYAKKRTNQVLWNSKIPNQKERALTRKRKYSCEESNLKIRSNIKQRQESFKRKREEHADLSKSSVTSESMSPEMVKNKMEKILSRILSTKKSFDNFNQNNERPNWVNQISPNQTPEQNNSFENKKSSTNRSPS